MTNSPPIAFTARTSVTFKWPLAPNARLLYPEQVMLDIDGHVYDIGAYCYISRSDKLRTPKAAREVSLSSFHKDRVPQIENLVRTLSRFGSDIGYRPKTVRGLVERLRIFMEWADTNGFQDCLAGGESTRNAYRQFAKYVEERFRQHQLTSSYASQLQNRVLKVLEEYSGLTDISKGLRLIKNTSGRSSGTEPVDQASFAHALALNESIFQGLCDLVLKNEKFPFKLAMPKTLGWDQSFLWLFPTHRWFLPPYHWGEKREQLEHPTWIYDYEQGRPATVEELFSRYVDKNSKNALAAKFRVKAAQATLEAANNDISNHWRRLLAMNAHNAFYFLFMANTSANAAPTIDIETDGEIDTETVNAGYRSIKWRAMGKKVSIVVPVAFMPALRRFMELRKYLLNGREFPYLFLSVGGGKRESIQQISPGLMPTQYKLLRRFDPQLRQMGPRRIRATTLAYYREKHDSAISAAVAQHLKETGDRDYDTGTEAAHHVEMSLFLGKVAQKAEQQIVSTHTTVDRTKPLEEGGACQSYGQPQALASDVPVKPNCKTGCLFCTKRVLIAGEDDARKVASAAFLMEQLIINPMAEAEFRPLIDKCDEDLKKIRAFDGCADMVDRVKKDVFENGNLTPYYSDKYELLLSLEIL
jgi:hypothetical protein